MKVSPYHILLGGLLLPILVHYRYSKEKDEVIILETGGGYVHGEVPGKVPYAREVYFR